MGDAKQLELPRATVPGKRPNGDPADFEPCPKSIERGSLCGNACELCHALLKRAGALVELGALVEALVAGVEHDWITRALDRPARGHHLRDGADAAAGRQLGHGGLARGLPDPRKAGDAYRRGER